MFTMKYDISIGRYKVGMLEKVEINRSVELLADTATIVLPAAEYNQALEVVKKNWKTIGLRGILLTTKN